MSRQKDFSGPSVRVVCRAVGKKLHVEDVGDRRDYGVLGPTNSEVCRVVLGLRSTARATRESGLPVVSASLALSTVDALRVNH